MRKLQMISFYPWCVLLVLFLTVNAYGLEASSSGAILPDGLIIEDAFKPGIGLPVGKVQLVQGEVVILHADQERGYLAKRDLPLYKGDTIVTKEQGRIRIKLNDESVLTLASRTKLKITQSVYEPAKKIRSSFFDMAVGKARFWAKKFIDYKQSLFKVKTQTAVVGVRGSEWVEEVTENATKVTAFENTALEVVSTAVPEIQPTVVEDFQQTVVETGKPPSDIVKVSAEEIEQMKKDFTVTPEGRETGAKVEVQKEKKAAETKKVAVQAAEETGAALIPAVMVNEILVSEDELVDPVPIIIEQTGEGFETDVIIEEIETVSALEDIVTTGDAVIEETPPEPPVGTEGSISVNW